MRFAWQGARAAMLALCALVVSVAPLHVESLSITAVAAAPQGAADSSLATRLRERVQMHGNSLRGLAYVSTWYPDHSIEPAQLHMRPRTIISLDGDGTDNVRGAVYPIDINGDH